MKIITSPDNVEIKTIANLQTPKGRHKHRQFIAEGIRAIKTLVDAGMQPQSIYCLEKNLPEAKSLTGNEYTIVIINEKVLQKISTSSTPSGIVATFAIPTPRIEELSAGIVLAQVQDPGNVGTLIRTAAAMNVKTVVCIEGCSPWSPKVIQSTAGTIGMVNIFELSWQELIAHKKDLILYALVVHHGKNPTTIDQANALIVIGNEANGIPEAWVNDCDEKITLPMPGHTESLNAAVAGSIALYTAFNH